MLLRILEPELMDSDDDAREYDAMDHAAVNELFVADLIVAFSDWSLKRPVQSVASQFNVLDLGAGTAQIPIELARRAPHVHITALDAASSMLALARQNIAAAGVADRVAPLLADAKQLPFDAEAFHVSISNSILHHIPQPREVIAESVRVTALGGLLFHRDLCRPRDESELAHIVETYAAEANVYQRKLFADSLHAALTLIEMQRLVAEFGFAPATVRMTSDRHWTWSATNIWPGRANELLFDAAGR
jgi:ubiquinone/menaquinone biosynthesis C-methylase UbiE